MTLSRRGFIAGLVAGGFVRSVPMIGTSPGGRRILTLVYDKALGGLRAVERVVP